MDTPLPSGLRPSAQRVTSGNAISDGTTVDATFVIGTDGSITVSLTSEDDFSSTGTNGLNLQGINYFK
jgi:hypothetical protein